MEKQNNNGKYVETFNPDVYLYNHFKHQDLLLLFDAGDKALTFNDFVKYEAENKQLSGDGVTYVVCNCNYNGGEKIPDDIVAFYTLSTTSIPFEDRIKIDLDPENTEYESELCGIPSIELKLFAVDKRYQDKFFAYDGTEMPISAWILSSIIHQADEMTKECIGAKAVFLRSVKEAEDFYIKNGFKTIETNMYPLHDIDSELKAMYYKLHDFYMNYDE